MSPKLLAVQQLPHSYPYRKIFRCCLCREFKGSSGVVRTWGRRKSVVGLAGASNGCSRAMTARRADGRACNMAGHREQKSMCTGAGLE